MECKQGEVAADAQLILVFHSTLHSSQSSRVRFMSHPAASTPGDTTNKTQVLLVKNANSEDF